MTTKLVITIGANNGKCGDCRFFKKSSKATIPHTDFCTMFDIAIVDHNCCEACVKQQAKVFLSYVQHESKGSKVVVSEFPTRQDAITCLTERVQNRTFAVESPLMIEGVRCALSLAPAMVIKMGDEAITVTEKPDDDVKV